MENSQQLATESFSYTWLTDKEQSSYDALFNSLSETEEHNFNFDVPLSKSSIAFVHADEIFFNGHIMPFYVNKSKIETLRTSNSVPSSPVTSCSPRSPSSDNKIQFYEKWRKSSRRIMQKCFGFVRKIGFSRKSSRVDDLEKTVVSNHAIFVLPRSQSSVGEWADVKKVSNKVDFYYGLKRVKSWSSSAQASPCICPPSITTCDSESSIHEAIMYCKRSLGV